MIASSGKRWRNSIQTGSAGYGDWLNANRFGTRFLAQAKDLQPNAAIVRGVSVDWHFSRFPFPKGCCCARGRHIQSGMKVSLAVIGIEGSTLQDHGNQFVHAAIHRSPFRMHCIFHKIPLSVSI